VFYLVTIFELQALCKKSVIDIFFPKEGAGGTKGEKWE